MSQISKDAAYGKRTVVDFYTKKTVCGGGLPELFLFGVFYYYYGLGTYTILVIVYHSAVTID